MAKKKSKSLKRTIKFLATCKQPEVVSQIIAKAPDNVIKSICNAAINTARGEVTLKKHQKKILSKHRNFIEQLVRKGETAQQKRKIFLQHGSGFPALIIPVILSSVLSALGSRLFE